MEDIEYKNSFKEILEILSYISRDDYEKIPTNLIDIFENNSNKMHEFKYDSKKTLEEQGCSDITKTLLSLLYRDYWADADEKINLLLEEKELRKIYQEELKEKYNPDNLFKNKKSSTLASDDDISQKVSMVEYREKSFIQRILDKIKQFFR